jgi:methylphosphotriester-DNA--protein-cysteine methyltransferase
MRCARCHRDTPSVQQREGFWARYLCDVCNEYEETWQAYKAESMNKDPTEFHRLYDRLGELSDKIDGFLKEQRLESEKNVGPPISKKDRPTEEF